MAIKGQALIIIGVLGTALVLSFDPLMRKPVNDFTGPVSTPALIICGILVLIGSFLSVKKTKKRPVKRSR